MSEIHLNNVSLDLELFNALNAKALENGSKITEELMQCATNWLKIERELGKDAFKELQESE